MQELFVTTRDLLVDMAEASGLTYKEVNVLVWYFCIPLTWAILFDLISGNHRGKLVAGVICVVAGLTLYFTGLTEWLFDWSCELLLGSNVGGNYVNASVIICLFVPVVIYAIMIPWAVIATWKRRNQMKIDDVETDSTFKAMD